ncbi:MAG: acyl-CoA synthetase FdrA [Beijerinckiaceae bacterium]
MSVIINEIRRGLYLDSVALMRLSRTVAAMPDVEEAGLMMGTPANKEIMRDARVLDVQGEAAAAGDLVLAIRAKNSDAAQAALKEARALIDKPKVASDGASAWQPRSIRAAVAAHADANIALISVPGDFAAAEARKALQRGLNVMMFSDNVALDDEVALKQEARELGLLVMGPDCGTAIIAGVPLAFANKVPRGRIGIVGASGTGIQEVSCLIAQMGGGISHAIGTGGRDLKADVGGITALQAIDLLDADSETDHIVLISKPPAEAVAKKIMARVAQSKKSFTVCFIGAGAIALPDNARAAATLKQAAEMALGRGLPQERTQLARPANGGTLVRGLFSGGTLCAEAQLVFRDAQIAVASNVPVPGATMMQGVHGAHVMIDLGDDEYTRGRPHPMIEPSVRDDVLRDALVDKTVGVVLVDIVLGYGGHMDPAGHLASVIQNRAAGGPHIVASVTGVEDDPQILSVQIAKLRAAGIHVAPSNADAAALAVSAIQA